MLIINATVHTMEGLTIPNGYVAVSGDKIARVGPMEECPGHWEGETVDAGQGHVTPGFVDAHSHLGMFGDALGFEGDKLDALKEAFKPYCTEIVEVTTAENFS